LRLNILSLNLIILLAIVFYPLRVRYVILSRVSFSIQQEVAYLTARLEKIKVSEKMIENDLSQVDQSTTKSTYKLGVGFERGEKKDEKSAPKFVPSSNYHKEEEALKPTKIHYPSNPKPSFNPKRSVKKETTKPKEEAFVCMFCGHTDHLYEFAFSARELRKCALIMLETHIVMSSLISWN
jgi:hypothetical protein